MTERRLPDEPGSASVRHPVRALIVDDEPLARLNLQRALEPFAHWRVQAACADAASALAEVAREMPQVVFLDIRMPRTSGLVLARRLSEFPAPPFVVFVTAYENHAVEAFELHALDYLIKPFDDARLAVGLQRIESLLDLRAEAAYGDALRGFLADAAPEAALPSEGLPHTTHYLEQFSVKSVGRIDLVRVADVRWIASAGNYVELHLEKRSVLHRVTLTALEARLDPAEFLRVHRRVIVRRRECRSLTVTGDGTYELRLHGGARVPVSERFIDQLRESMAER
ncbi:MAG: response regulator transcription factor [Gemmatimonadaceae bacterium]|nr:response regulator transcription factor [Gemmatimonadaceae bacterium]